MIFGVCEVGEVEIGEFSELRKCNLVLVELDRVLEAVQHMHEAQEVRTR